MIKPFGRLRQQKKITSDNPDKPVAEQDRRGTTGQTSAETSKRRIAFKISVPISTLAFMGANGLLVAIGLIFAFHVGLTSHIQPYPTLPTFMTELLATRPEGVNTIQSSVTDEPAKLVSLIPDVIEQTRRTLPPEIAQHVVMEGRRYVNGIYYVALTKDFYNLSATQTRFALQKLVEYLSLYGIEPVKFMVDLEVVHYMDRTFTYPDVYNDWDTP